MSCFFNIFLFFIQPLFFINVKVAQTFNFFLPKIGFLSIYHFTNFKVSYVMNQPVEFNNLYFTTMDMNVSPFILKNKNKY